MRRWSFVKAHGLGNDFLLHLARRGEHPVSAAEVTALCDRRRGLGADGVMVLEVLRGPRHLRMTLYNADGTPAELSGNGLRCAIAAVERLWAPWGGGDVVLETVVGIRSGRQIGEWEEEASEGLVQVTMGRAEFGAERVPAAESTSSDGEGFLILSAGAEFFRGVPLSLGNPHFVLPVQELPDDEEVARWGPVLENHPAFPERSNIMWLAKGSGGLRLLIWERGCGVTPACGSGACAAAAVAERLAWVARERPVRVMMAGGDVEVAWSTGVQGEILLTGPVTIVAVGELLL